MAELVGWREWVRLPDLGIDRIKVKVDTGARISALHACRLTSVLVDGEEWVEFVLHPLPDNTLVEVACRAPVKAHRVVRNSGGREETRVVIETTVQLGDHTWPIELTLTDRENMALRMLLGRTAIRNRFYVDPGRAFVLTPADSGSQPGRRQRLRRASTKTH